MADIVEEAQTDIPLVEDVSTEEVEAESVTTNNEDESLNSSLAEKTTPEAVATTTSAAHQDVAEIPARLWFVRVPRPADIADIREMDSDAEAYKAQLRLLNELLDVKKMEREVARDDVKAARDMLKHCKAECDQAFSHVDRLRETTRGGLSVRKLREEYSDLIVYSLDQLEAKVEELNHKISHESIPLNEEKKLVATLKKLEQQRPRVEQYEEAISVAAESKPDREHLSEQLAELEGELKVLKGERDTQAAIVERFKEKADALDNEVSLLLGKRRQAREALDAVHAKITEARSHQYEKNSFYSANRRLSREVRKVLSQGKWEEAEKMCREETEKLMARLEENKEFRTEYFDLWEQQRKVPIPLKNLTGSAGATNHHHQEEDPLEIQAEQALLPLVETQKRAQQRIEAILHEAEEEVAHKHKLEAAAAAAQHHHHHQESSNTAAAGGNSLHSSSTAASTTMTNGGNGVDGLVIGKPKVYAPKPPKPTPPSSTTSATTTSVVGAESLSSSQSHPQHSHHHHHHTKKHAATTAAAPEPEPTVPDFELPDVVKQRSQPAALSKEDERERNRKLQQEAEQRKKKREEEKVRRRQKAAAMSSAEHSRTGSKSGNNSEDGFTTTTGANGHANGHNNVPYVVAAALQATGMATTDSPAEPVASATDSTTTSEMQQQQKLKKALESGLKDRETITAVELSLNQAIPLSMAKVMVAKPAARRPVGSSKRKGHWMRQIKKIEPIVSVVLLSIVFIVLGVMMGRSRMAAYVH